MASDERGFPPPPPLVDEAHVVVARREGWGSDRAEPGFGMPLALLGETEREEPRSDEPVLATDSRPVKRQRRSDIYRQDGCGVEIDWGTARKGDREVTK